MTDAITRPLLFLDVDGTLIPFGASPQQRAGASPGFTADEASNPLLARLNPDHGRLLAALPCQLVWATTWMSEANQEIAPRLGLPQLPVVDWPDCAGEEDDELHWKTRALVDWAEGRAFVWVDDEIAENDRAYVREHHRGRALLQQIDSRLGVTDTDIVAIGEWLAQL